MIRLRILTFTLVLGVLLGTLPPATTPSVEAADVAALAAVTDTDGRWGFNAIYPDARWQQLAKDAGATWNRWEFRWDNIEPTRGANGYGDFDSVVNNSIAHGISVQGILISVPEWARDRQNPSLSSGLYRNWNDPENLWGQYVRKTVQRYQGKVKYWEVWNEPDFAEIFWGATVADYYQLLKVAYLNIKAVDRGNQVILAGLAYWYDPTFLDELLKLMASDPIARDNNSFFDILAWHTYSGPPGVVDRVTQSRQKLATTVGPRPIWINETNVPPYEESRLNNFQPFPFSATMQEQAAYMIQTFAYAVGVNADKVMVYRLRDDVRENQAFGLVRDNGTVRPGYVGFQVAARYLSHASDGVIQRQGPTETVSYRRPSERGMVVWNVTGTKQSVKLGSRATSATVVDQTGATRTIRTTNGQYLLDLPPATANHDEHPTDYLIGGQPFILIESPAGNMQNAEENAPGLAFSGNWENQSPAGASGGAVKRASSAGFASAVEFDGSSITWITSKGPDHGIARVEVDGVVQGEIDLYSPTAISNFPLTFGDFSTGAHRMVITALGRRTGSSSGTVVAVDAFQANTIRPAASPLPAPAPSGAPLVPPIGPTIRSQAAAYSAVASPATKLSVPIVMRNRNSYTTTISIENSGDDAATATIRFLDEQGRQVTSLPFTLNPVAAFTVDPRSVAGLPEGFVGSATVESNQPLTASVTQARDNSDALSYTAVGAGSSRAYVPLLFKGYNGWDTGLQVQNLGSTPVSVNVVYRRSNGPGGPWTETQTIQPNAAATFYQPANGQLPAGFVGSAVVEGPVDSQLTAIVNEIHQSGSGSAYESSKGGSSTINAPLLFKNAGGWNTGLQVQNIGQAPTDVVVAYRASDGRGPWFERGTIAPGAAATFYQPANAQLPDGFVGSAVVTSSNGQPLVGIVNEVHTGRNVAMTYQGFGDGSPMITAPYAARNAGGWSTGLQVQNLGADETTLVVLLQDETGVLTKSLTDKVVGGSSRTYYLPNVDGIPDGWRGSATIISTTGAPLAAIVNETRY